jgi:hypothetical protein
MWPVSDKPGPTAEERARRIYGQNVVDISVIAGEILAAEAAARKEVRESVKNALGDVWGWYQPDDSEDRPLVAILSDVAKDARRDRRAVLRDLIHDADKCPKCGDDPSVAFCSDCPDTDVVIARAVVRERERCRALWREERERLKQVILCDNCRPSGRASCYACLHLWEQMDNKEVDHA